MKRMVALSLLLGSAACAPSSDDAPRASGGGTVLVMVMDGVRPGESLGDEASLATGESPRDFMPRTWSSLVPQGVRATNAWTLAATTTAPGHAAMVCGRRQPLANFPVEDSPGLYRPELPTLPELLRRSGDVPPGQAIIVANSELLSPMTQSLWPLDGEQHAGEFVFVANQDYDDAGSGSDDLVIHQVMQRLIFDHPSFVLANLHQVDRSGHFGSYYDYPDEARLLDRPLVELWEWLQRQDTFKDNTWMLLIADHGRHSISDDDPTWRHHGCSCNGCRRLPFLLLGPGVNQAAELDDPLLLTDVAPTLAALLDLDMPWADGMVRDDLFQQPTGHPGRSGVAAIAVSGGLVAQVVYKDDPAHRSELRLDGQILSDPQAIAVEAPALATDLDQAWLCFREILLEPQQDESPWIPRCLHSSDGAQTWEDIGAPTATATADWQVKLIPWDGDSLLAVYAINPNGMAISGYQAEQDRIEAALYQDGSWIVAQAQSVPSFPTFIDAVESDDGVLLAVGASRDGAFARYTRDIYTARVQVVEGWPRVSNLKSMGLAPSMGQEGEWRFEHPAMRAGDDGVLELALLAFQDGANNGLVLRSTDHGITWEEPGLLNLPGSTMPNITPRWVEDRAIFAVVDRDTGEARLCAGNLDSEPVCVDAMSPRILDLAVDQDMVYAIVDRSSGEWEEARWSASELGI